MKLIIRLYQVFQKLPLFLVSLSLLIFILVIGTIDQKYIGLYQSQQKYFSSFFFLLFGVIPFPGARLLLIVIFINLSVNFISKFHQYKKKIGVIVIHVSVALLLLGGFITAYFSVEGSMVIEEGRTVNFYQDYHKMEFNIVQQISNFNNQNFNKIISFRKGYLQKNQILYHQNFSGEIKILKFYDNCRIVNRLDKDNIKLKGIAKRFDIKKRLYHKKEDKNIAAVVVELKGIDKQQDGVYLVIERMIKKDFIQVGDKKYFLQLKNMHYPLSFAIQCIDFKKVSYPGIDKAKEYSSEVKVIDKGVTNSHLIHMNHPLRLYNYTFYQASFIDGKQGKDTTVLAVVKNYGRLFPYISSIVICIGLLLQIIIRVPQLIKRKKY